MLDSYESLGYYLRQFGKGEKVRPYPQRRPHPHPHPRPNPSANPSPKL